MSFIPKITFGLFIYAMVFNAISQEHTNPITPEHKKWLKDKFSIQHQQIMPKVAVADMFYGCNLSRNTEPTHVPLKMLIEKIDKNSLAQKLSTCLGEQTLQSDEALNFGLIGCYSDHFSALSEQDRKEKLELVHGAITRLSKEERQKSFTKCVTEQAIKYLK